MASTLVKDYTESPNDFLFDYERWYFLYEKNFLNRKTIKFEVPKRIDSKKLLFLNKALINGFIHNEVNFSQESLTAAKIIASNTTKRPKMEKVCQHRKCQETPLLIYSSLKIYSICCSRNIIGHFFSTGICVSSDRIL